MKKIKINYPLAVLILLIIVVEFELYKQFGVRVYHHQGSTLIGILLGLLIRAYYPFKKEIE